MKGFIIYPTYADIDGNTFVEFYGRLENGESFVTKNKFKPYLFIKKDELKRTEKITKSFEIKIEETELTDFKKNKVIKIISKNQSEFNKLIKELNENEIESFEADIKPQYRFIIDNNLLGSIEIEGEYTKSEKINRIYLEAKITPAKETKTELKIASVDIETGEKNKLLCIGIYSKDYKKNFMITPEKLENVISCKDEKECLENFKNELILLDPDIITGWNVIDFDFNYLKERFTKNKISFDIGRDNSNPSIRIEGNFFKKSTMDICGRLVLDGLSFVKDPYIKEAPTIRNTEFETYTLEDVSQAFLGKGKVLSSKERHKEINELYEGDKKDLQKLADYNLMDCQLVYEILEKTKMIELAIERSELTGMPLDRITASIASFDSLYIREARKRNLVSPSTKFTSKEEKIKGGFVMSPKPGLYHNVLVLDFKSLYPSIIKTFNIDPASFLEQGENGAIESPNGAYFKNQDGILPLIIERLHQAREKAKKEKRELSSYAIKIIMNSFFGVLASPNCRYFDLKIANAITNFGQETIKLTTTKIEELGYKVVYGDTDSVFVNLGKDKQEAEKLGKEITGSINEFYKQYVREKFNRHSYLELQFAKLYHAMIMPQIRTKIQKNDDEDVENKIEARGAKKRYAGLLTKDGKEELDIVGLEAIRGDWTEAAKEFQKKLLLKVFHNEEATRFIKNFIKELKEGKMDKQLVYRKSIRKELEEYTKTTPPHVKAARQLDEMEGNIISYFITVNGPEPIQKLRHKLDYDHYIEKQIEPIAKTILETMNLDYKEAISGSKQKTLF